MFHCIEKLDGSSSESPKSDQCLCLSDTGVSNSFPRGELKLKLQDCTAVSPNFKFCNQGVKVQGFVKHDRVQLDTFPLLTGLASQCFLSRFLS